MDLHLNAEEIDVLHWVLQREMGAVREEAYKTDDSEYKRGVKEREAIVASLLEKVGGSLNPGSVRR